MKEPEKNTEHVLVLGHTGFIGRAVSESLTRGGYNVIGASSRECDLLDPVATARFLDTLPGAVSVVFSSGILRSADDTHETLVKNMSMVGNFLAGAPRDRLAAVVYLSSTSLYGRNPELPITEKSLPNPANYYDIAKVANESLLTLPGALECPVTVLRLPGTYGQGDWGVSLVARFLDQMRSTGSVKIFGDGETKRDLVAIEDIVAVVEGVVKKPLEGRLNVATGTSLSILEIVETVADAAGLAPRIEYGPADVSTPTSLVYDTRALLEWLPGLRFTSFAEGCAAYITAASMPAS